MRPAPAPAGASPSEGSLGGHRAEGALVGADRLLDVVLGVHRGHPAVIHRAVHALVEDRATEQMIVIALARAIEPGQPRLALERDVIDGRLAVAGPGHARALHRLAEPAAKL